MWCNFSCSFTMPFKSTHVRCFLFSLYKSNVALVILITLCKNLTILKYIDYMKKETEDWMTLWLSALDKTLNLKALRLIQEKYDECVHFILNHFLQHLVTIVCSFSSFFLVYNFARLWEMWWPLSSLDNNWSQTKILIAKDSLIECFFTKESKAWCLIFHFTVLPDPPEKLYIWHCFFKINWSYSVSKGKLKNKNLEKALFV